MTTPDPDTLLAEARTFNVELERLLATIPAASRRRMDARGE